MTAATDGLADGSLRTVTSAPVANACTAVEDIAIAGSSPER